MADTAGDSRTDLQSLFPESSKEEISLICDILTLIAGKVLNERLLLSVWSTVNSFLRLQENSRPNRRLAKSEEFIANVDESGRGDFFKMLRESAMDETGSGWARFFLNGMFISFPSPEVHQSIFASRCVLYTNAYIALCC